MCVSWDFQKVKYIDSTVNMDIDRDPIKKVIRVEEERTTKCGMSFR